MRGAQNRGGGVDHRSVAHCLALLVFGSFHGLELRHAVGKLAGTGDEGLDIVLDSRLVERVNLVKEKNKSVTGSSSILLVTCTF